MKINKVVISVGYAEAIHFSDVSSPDGLSSYQFMLLQFSRMDMILKLSVSSLSSTEYFVAFNKIFCSFSDLGTVHCTVQVA